MARGKWTWDNEKKCLIETSRPKSSEMHSFIADEIPGGIKSMVDKKIYTSKSKLRQHYRESGVTEIGEETEYSPKSTHWMETEQYQKRLKEDAEKTYYELRDGMADLSEFDRERCKIINHNMKYYNYDRRDYDRDGKLRK